MTVANDDTSFWVKIAMSVAATVIIGPPDVAGAGGVPAVPDKLLFVLAGIWGIDLLEGDGS